MDTTRFILVISLSLVIMLLWDAWQRDYGTTATVEESVPRVAADKEFNRANDLPALPEDVSGENIVREETGSAQQKKKIAVTTDLFSVSIDLHGGTLSSARLLELPVSLDNPEEPVEILTDTNDQVYIIQGGLLSDRQAPTHDATYSSDRSEYVLADGADVLQVPLYWKSDDGVEVIKLYEFSRNKYQIKIRYEIANHSPEEWKARAYAQIQRTGKEDEGRGVIYTYTGAVLSSPDNRYEKISFEDMAEEKISRTIRGGWAAMIKHYFVTALIPGSGDDEYHYYSLYLDSRKTGLSRDRYVIGATGPLLSVKPGDVTQQMQSLYVGPKSQHRLEDLAPGLELTVDYGKLWFIAKPLFWCLEKFFSLTGNWGWSIILVTLMLKLLFYNLSAAGYRSMARMRKVQPRLVAIRDRYKDDKTRLNKAMMDLYKQEKINPLGGCFPILVQIPVFIALYWVLLESVELRQAGFIFWLRDLSTPDPYFILPLVMGVTMFIQQKLNPAPMDPVQEKVMMTLPFVFTIFFAFFPSGLVLYWVVNNVLSIAQQWLIMRNLDRAGLKNP